MTLRENIAEARTVVLGETTAAPLPLAIRALLALVRKDAKARDVMLGEAEGTMERFVERLTTPAYVPAPAKKGRGKKGAVVPPPVPAVPTVKVHELTADELVTKVLAALDKDSVGAVSNAIDRAHYEEDFEKYVIAKINGDLRAFRDIGPWSMDVETKPNSIFMRFTFAGEEQEEGTQHPGHTEADNIARSLKRTLGAVEADVRWELGDTPSNWGFGSGDLFVVSYHGTARWEFAEGQALLFTLGRKALVDVAEKVLARARADAEDE